QALKEKERGKRRKKEELEKTVKKKKDQDIPSLIKAMLLNKSQEETEPKANLTSSLK
ncbi:6014_t:CDS:1, partial [Cetraspora pellucida]